MADQSLSEQLSEVSEQLETIEQSETVSTDDITAFSLMPDEMQPGDSVTWSNLIDGLKQYHNYSPGQPTEIPVVDEQPRLKLR